MVAEINGGGMGGGAESGTANGPASGQGGGFLPPWSCFDSDGDYVSGRAGDGQAYRIRCDTPEEAGLSLVGAIMRQAVADYFVLYRAGIVKGLEPTGHFPTRTNGKDRAPYYQSFTPLLVRELCDFFHKDMRRLFMVAGVIISADRIRLHMLRMEAESAPLVRQPTGDDL